MSDNFAELIDLYKRKFIIRGDAKAVQDNNGEWRPATTGSGSSRSLLPWSNDDILAHLNKSSTFGHYLLNRDSKVKLFAFDIDLEETGILPSAPHPSSFDPNFSEADISDWETSFQPTNPREAWRVRNHPARDYMKQQFREVAHMICKVLHEMGEPCAVAYSGSKGIHVYAFAGKMDAADAREGGRICLNAVGNFELFKGENFYRNAKFPNLSIEVFPKQDKLPEMEGIGGLGNLMRLPLGRNLKSPKDPTFFVDMSAPLNELRPVDPVWALTEGANNVWKKPGE